MYTIKESLLTKPLWNHKITTIIVIHRCQSNRYLLPVILLFPILFFVSCSNSANSTMDKTEQIELAFTLREEQDEILVDKYERVEPPSGCKDQTYPDPATSPYILPFVTGETFETGLTNCSSSYHSAGNPDEYAFDFDMPIGTPFIAARGGTVFELWDEERSSGGGVGNFLIIDHHDGTYGLYYHSPQEGFDVEIGDEVQQGDVLGVTGRSGLAGYPHLHFIVVKDDPNFPYEGIAVSFSNASPADAILKSNTFYTALEP